MATVKSCSVENKHEFTLCYAPQAWITHTHTHIDSSAPIESLIMEIICMNAIKWNSGEASRCAFTWKKIKHIDQIADTRSIWTSKLAHHKRFHVGLSKSRFHTTQENSICYVWHQLFGHACKQYSFEFWINNRLWKYHSVKLRWPFTMNIKMCVSFWYISKIKIKTNHATASCKGKSFQSFNHNSVPIPKNISRGINIT